MSNFAGGGNFHDLCLLALGLDTMLRSSDLLSLTVADVCHPNGTSRRQMRRKQQKTKHNVHLMVLSTNWRKHVSDAKGVFGQPFLQFPVHLIWLAALVDLE